MNRIIAFYYAIFHFGLHRLKSYHVRFEQEKMPYLYPIDEAIGH